MCMGVLPVGMYVGRELEYTGFGVTDGCELPSCCWEFGPGTLEEQSYDLFFFFFNLYNIF